MTFLTPTGSFQWVSLPTGSPNSPAYYIEASNKMLHYAPVLDADGKPIYDSENLVRLVKDVLDWVTNYFDDILITSLLNNTYAETLALHFKNVEKVIQWSAFHGAKISLLKSTFAKSKILFLGWFVCNDYVIAEPRQIEKIRQFQFPDSKKNIRAFLGLLNSLRHVISTNIIAEINHLTPLTSSTKPYLPTEQQKQAFEKLKVMMTSAPLYNKLIDEQADKLLWVDAATSTGALGAVLAQKVKGKSGEKVVPPALDLDNKVHQMIFDHEWNYQPAKIYLKIPIAPLTPTVAKTSPPKIISHEKFLGFTEDMVIDSFFLSTASLLAVYNCKPPQSTLEQRKMATKELKKGVLALKLRDFCFNNNYGKYKEFLTEFEQGKQSMDPNLLLAESLAQALY